MRRARRRMRGIGRFCWEAGNRTRRTEFDLHEKKTMPEALQAAYSTVLVSYIDILGFQQLINESQTNASKIAEIQSLLEQLNQLGDTARRHPKHSGQRFAPFNFSDLIVRSTTIENEMVWYDVVDWELFYLAGQQTNLVTQGVLLRGGVSIGNLFVSADYRIVFGPALVRSYKLESDYAIHPRLVIDEAIVIEARSRGYFPGMGDFICRGEDGVYFLDYFFGTCISEAVLFPVIEDVRARIVAHRKAIEMAVNRTQSADERVKQKYVWLTLYHNSTVRRLAERLGSKRIGSIGELLAPDPEDTL